MGEILVKQKDCERLKLNTHRREGQGKPLYNTVNPWGFGDDMKFENLTWA